LWILTAGLGPFYGSARRKQASSFWFGLDFPAATVIRPEGGNIWFGSCRSDYQLTALSGVAAQSNGALVRAKPDLSGWKAFPAQLETGFGDGCVRDVKGWRDYIWLATDKGIVRHNPVTGHFRTYRHLMGGTDIRVNHLLVHQGLLYAATERGVCYLDSPDKEEIKTLGELPVAGGVPVYELASKDKDLWAATRYGLQVFQGGSWKSLNAVSAKDVPEATNVPSPSVAHHDTSLYWIYGNRVMVKPRKKEQRVLLERDRPLLLRFDGDILYVAFYSGVTAYDTRKGLWADFRLEDGIPGTRVLTMAVDGGRLWIGTDAGVERISLRPYLP
jgi:ligand-binding sensor domain-containing protein